MTSRILLFSFPEVFTKIICINLCMSRLFSMFKGTINTCMSVTADFTICDAIDQNQESLCHTRGVVRRPVFVVRRVSSVSTITVKLPEIIKISNSY